MWPTTQPIITNNNNAEYYNSIPHMIALCNTVGVVLEVNNKWREYSGNEEIDH